MIRNEVIVKTTTFNETHCYCDICNEEIQITPDTFDERLRAEWYAINYHIVALHKKQIYHFCNKCILSKQVPEWAKKYL